MIGRPAQPECFEYYWRYIDKVPGGEVIDFLKSGLRQTLEVLGGLSEEQANYRYAPGKWSIKEVIGHVIDTERVFAYRALSFARGDPAHLPSMEQDDWAQASNAGQRSLTELLDDLEATRRCTIALFQSFDEEQTTLKGVASGYEFSVRSIVYIIAGHEQHHREVLEEHYL
jgi:uncharacterized damage-inducible protein DinB